MTGEQLIDGSKLVRGLIELGICDEFTSGVTITANVGEVVTLEIRKYGDDRLLKLLSDGHVVIAHTKEQAVAR